MPSEPLGEAPEGARGLDDDWQFDGDAPHFIANYVNLVSTGCPNLFRFRTNKLAKPVIGEPRHVDVEDAEHEFCGGVHGLPFVVGLLLRWNELWGVSWNASRTFC